MVEGLVDHSGRIMELSSEEVRKICAGEVVERPVSVVKELIENSLDSGATRISIELEDGGRQLIRVTDNGSGIRSDELLLAVKQHCTSKIRSLDDLFALSTLGFRGEALHSIGAVSRLTIASRAADAGQGGRIEVDAGEILSHGVDNIREGTEVEVRELFFNTPVRLKFLKSRQAEVSMVSSLLNAYALAHPGVAWRLSSSGNVLLNTSGGGKLSDVFSGMLGPEAAGKLVEIDFEFPPSAVAGLISDPAYHRHNRSRQWYFVNNRPVANKLLYKAVDDAVREFMSHGKYPAGAFFLDLPPEEIDVNVHPMKTEVNFAEPQTVYSLLLTAVKRALGKQASHHQRRLTRGLSSAVRPASGPAGTTEQPEPGAIPPPIALTEASLELDRPGLDETIPPGHRRIPVYRTPGTIIPPATAAGLADEVNAGKVTELMARAGDYREPPAMPLPDLDRLVITQVADSYLVITAPGAVYIIDQHAAHERVLFEELYEKLDPERGGHPVRQKLLFPLVTKLTTAEVELFHQFRDGLNSLGFTAELGAGDNLMIMEIPQLLTGRATAELVHGAFEELSESRPSTVLLEQFKDLAASIACKAAIKAGDRLDARERRELVSQLLSRWSSLTCPHGRPTVLMLGPAELARMFLR